MTSELEGAEQQLRIFEGFLAVLGRRSELLEIVERSETADEARRAVARQFGLDEIQAQAVMDLQVRRFAAGERAKIEERVEGLKRYVATLR
ncbi:DNA gyrase subunit A [Kribbella sp. NPDC006257]|uniref:DNA gyrase subunit A n=1 Tax=Kribbella sp. NPDC006257 TaxID=3156738 RepID=UPI0033BA5271